MKLVLLIALFFYTSAHTQSVPIEKQKFVYFPHPLMHKWTASIGITAATMPYEITEELHYRIPAGDFHVLRKLNNSFYLDGRITFQVIQNLVTLGPRWSRKVSDKVSYSLGNDVGYWFGTVNVEGFRTRGSGWENCPNISLGYRFNRQILLTIKSEAIFTYGIKTFAGNIPVTTNYKHFSGSSYTITIEQPFFGNKSLTLGLRAIYTNFFWQTWSAFSSFDRIFFYPQLIVGIIL
ncbi:MAG TPA: hypothetical protein VFQ58_11105 [Flavisolibacter sp.]|jgi:hypothetical protein|nr:hypothetical protein [Flavisolibacter sp.]